jgi:hypothetical protein
MDQFRMRRSRRNVLRLLGLSALLVAALGGAAVSGWLPPLNHWVERRLLAELRSAGLETDATHLRELSWRRAVVGPVELHLPGVSLRAEEARAELGLNVLAGRTAPQVIVRGVVLEAQVDRLNELRGMLQSPSGVLPIGRLDIEQARVVLRRGERRLELPCSGYFESDNSGYRSVLVVESAALAGRFSVRGGGKDGSVAIGVHDVRLQPEAWRTVAEGIAPAAALAVHFASEAQLRVSGTAELVGGAWRTVKAEGEFPASEWCSGVDSASVGAGRLSMEIGAAGVWRGEFSAERMVWASGDRSAKLERPTLVLEPRTARLSFAGGRVALSGCEISGGGEATARRESSDAPWSGEALLRLEAAGAAGWSLGAPAEVRARWNGAELGVAAEELELRGACSLRLAGLEATVAGLLEGSPRLVAQAQVAADVGGWLAANGNALRLQPAGVSAKMTLNASLETGREGVRAELALPAQRRALIWPEGRVEAVLGGEAVVNLDRSHISGRTALEAHEIIVRQGGWSLMVPEATATVRWPRVWHGAFAQWAQVPIGRVLRDLLWVGDYDAETADAVVRGGSEWCATGVALRLRGRGAEMHEIGGLEIAASAAELTNNSGLRTAEWKAEATAGLEGGTLRIGFALPDLSIRPTCAQTVRWSDGLEAEGSFGFDLATLSGKEPLVRWFPQLAGWELRGGVGLNGRSRYAQGEWTLGADAILSNFAARNAVQNLAVEGVRGRVVLETLLPLGTAPAQELTYERVQLGPVELTGGSVAFAYAAPGRLSVERWTSGGFGGRLECTPFACDLRNPELETRLNLKGVQTGQLLKLFNDVPAEADAAVDGSLPVYWRDGKAGFGTGWLKLAPGELGKVRFTQDLHLLTQGRRPVGPGYAALRQVEQAIQVLLFNRFQVDTYPSGIDGQPMRIRLVGTPAGREFDVPVTLDVNVNAPLEHFLNWGLGNGPKAAPRPAAP